MDLQELASSIIDDARREATRIDTESHEQATRIETETERLLRDRRERMLADAQRRRDEAIRRESAKTERASRLAVLTCKRELLDGVFAQASERIAATRGNARKATIARLLAHARKGLPIASVTATKADAAVLRSMGVRVRSTIDGDGGFIAHDASGNVSIDMRFETIIDQVRLAHTGEIAQLLFARETEKGAPAKRKKRKAR